MKDRENKTKQKYTHIHTEKKTRKTSTGNNSAKHENCYHLLNI